ncbi:ubiquinone biosynthesis protein [Massilia sp. PAMC28688]|uniref:ubiquinone biosynthesis protein n=1 Tax=Massilia sp. PAMC28688 TaxID=2861283 RepID=UPI001C632174|nr:ubiquinone biosynthesis protein [Massilia sp. PAMC28688]QYF95294.1 ubiquinone biosynthesis protein [Massilia sp. PAMC28688]
MTLWQLLGSFPTAIPTVLLAVLLIYWLLSLVGLADMGEAIDIDAGHADGAGIHTLAGYLVALGLGGVPLSVAASVLVFFTWLGTALMHQYLLAWLPWDWPRYLAGTAVLLLAAALSLPIAARLLRPMRGLFVRHAAAGNASLVGRDCRVVTQTVDARFGRAEVQGQGSSINIRIWAREPNTLSRHSRAIIVAYDEASGQFEVQQAPGDQ